MAPTTQHIHGWGAEPWAELRTTGKTEHRRYSQGLSHQHLKTRPTICYLKHNLPPELQVLLFFLVSLFMSEAKIFKNSPLVKYNFLFLLK